MKPSELLATPDRWCKYVEAKDKNGKSISARSKKAVQWCILGAVKKCYSGNKCQEAYVKLYELCGRAASLFNDDQTTTHEMVLQKLKEAGL